MGTRQNAERGGSPLASFDHVIDPHFVTFSSSLYTTISNPNANPNTNPNPNHIPNPNPNPYPVVKVSGLGGSAPLHPFELPCNSMSPLIESIKCYFMPK